VQKAIEFGFHKNREFLFPQEKLQVSQKRPSSICCVRLSTARTSILLPRITINGLNSAWGMHVCLFVLSFAKTWRSAQLYSKRPDKCLNWTLFVVCLFTLAISHTMDNSFLLLHRALLLRLFLLFQLMHTFIPFKNTNSHSYLKHLKTY
jgi:hypothetical protein